MHCAASCSPSEDGFRTILDRAGPGATSPPTSTRGVLTRVVSGTTTSLAQTGRLTAEEMTESSPPAHPRSEGRSPAVQELGDRALHNCYGAGMSMEFGLFIGGWVPDYLDGRNDAAEHERLMTRRASPRSATAQLEVRRGSPSTTSSTSTRTSRPTRS